MGAIGKLALGIVVVLFSAFLLNIPHVYNSPTVENDLGDSIRRFGSYDELVMFLSHLPSGWNVKLGPYVTVTKTLTQAAEIRAASPNAAPRYSKTNIQVAGVDEADIVKTDGSYIYFASGNKVYLIKSYPPDTVDVVSTLKISGDAIGLFKHDDKLVVISSVVKNPWIVESSTTAGGVRTFIKPFMQPTVEIRVYDLSDLHNPESVRSVMVNGSYVSSRMIGSYVYIVVAQNIVYKDDKPLLPRLLVDGRIVEIPASEIYYSHAEDNVGYFYTLVVALDLSKASSQEPNVVSILTGFSTDIYVSHSNIYLAIPKSTTGRFETVIHRIELNGIELKPAASGVVGGGVINQFSMDEYNGYFRVATTTNPWGGGNLSNTIYILDMNLSKVGKLSNIAPGERIYSVRFMQDKAFVVTFRQMDPLFVIDLKNPRNPRILGKLKIPGFSTYLHPFMEGYLIGLGMETTVNRDTGAVLTEGLKLSLFDVTGYTNPKELHKLIIEGTYVNSEALYNHRAFLLDSENKLLVIPIMIQQTVETEHMKTPGAFSGYSFQGVLVFKIDPSRGIEIIGSITHVNGEEHMHGSGLVIKRALYIGEVLYTLSSRKMMMHSLLTLEKVGELTLE